MSTSNGIERFLEEQLVKRNNAVFQEDKECFDRTIEEVYSFQRRIALNSVKDNSMGFSFFIDNYYNHELGLEFFSKRMTNEVLFEKENVEGLIHKKYSCAMDLNKTDIKSFLYEIIAKYDKDLSDFMKNHENHIRTLDEYIEYVKRNWIDFKEGKHDFDILITELNNYYEENCLTCRCSKLDIYLHIFDKNGMLDKFRKYYDMEDTTLEEAKKLESNVIGTGLTEEEIVNIKTMERIVQTHNYNNVRKEGIRLILEND